MVERRDTELLLQQTPRFMAQISGADLSALSTAVSERLAKAQSGTRPDVGIAVSLFTKDSSAYGVGNALIDVDREMRRTAAYLEARSLRPDGGRGQLVLLESEETNSHDLLFVVFGTVQHLLLSDPIQFGLTLSWMWEHRPFRRGITVAATPTPYEVAVDRISTTAEHALAQGKDVRFRLEAAPDGGMTTAFEAVDSGRQLQAPT